MVLCNTECFSSTGWFVDYRIIIINLVIYLILKAEHLKPVIVFIFVTFI